MTQAGSSLTLTWMLAIGLTACGVTATDDSADGQTGQARQRIVGGTVSTPAQDATVMLINGDSSCSGSLIAENLVLTARHCVATPKDSATTDCVPYGATVNASVIAVKVGVSASFTSPAVAAHGKRIFVPATSNMCSFDVALIELDRPLTSVRLAPVRFSELGADEQTVAVGYGVDGDDRELANRMQRATTVLGVGPVAINYKTKQNTTLSYTLPQGDVATGESTCFGDSGGPLFDMQGRVVAITSRGIDDGGEKGHGNTCIDEPSIYAGVRFNEQLIREAAEAAGHPLPASDDASPSSRDTGTDDGSGDEAGDETDSDETDTEETPKKRKRSSIAQTSAGCSAAPQGTGRSTSALALIMLFLFARVGSHFVRSQRRAGATAPRRGSSRRAS